VDFSKVGRLELISVLCAVIALVSLFFLPWYDNTSIVAQASGGGICDPGNTTCTGWETFPILRWILLLGALAPVLLVYILVTSRKLSWAPGELTMVGAFAGLTLIIYNGIIDKPGTGVQETGVSLRYGYWIALLAGIGMASTAFMRSQQTGGRQARKAPGNV
jgi:hypothetical protein